MSGSPGRAIARRWLSQFSNIQNAVEAFEKLRTFAPDDAEALELQQILDMTVESPQGEAVALRSVVEAVGSRGPIVIERKAQQRTVRITANVTGRDMGSVAAEVGERLAEIPRPVGYDFVLGGDYEQQQDAFEELLIALALSLALVYMVLVSVLFGVGPEWPADVRAAIATAIVSMVVGAVSGYYFGQTTSRNRGSAP